MPHIIEERVIYRDTDAEGVVYYANYLAWFEKARGEYLRSLGHTLKDLRDKENIVFAVKKVECEYHYPAFYDDEVTIETVVTETGGVTITFTQKALEKHSKKLLVEGVFKTVCLDATTLKPRRIPSYLKK